jgi:protein-L-isoaspartate O-methyltransferase
VNVADLESAQRLQRLIAEGASTPAVVRAALLQIAPRDRDAWLDLVFQLEPPTEDGPELPRGAVPYLPCPVEAVLNVLEHARIQPSDVVVDVGSGAGRTSALLQLLTGASVIGLEIQPRLVQASRELMTRLKLKRFVAVEADARYVTRSAPSGTVFFLYCPFGPSSLETFLEALEPVARSRELRLCLVDLPLLERPWLRLVAPAGADSAVYCSTLAFESPDSLTQARLILDSHRRVVGRPLLPETSDLLERARALYQAPFVVLAHGLGPDPRFDYGNQLAQQLFELDWSALVALPSRLSAEPVDQAARQRLLDAVSSRGYIDDYSGVRVSSSGRRFRIDNATVWNLVDEDGSLHGQAATFAQWTPL